MIEYTHVWAYTELDFTFHMWKYFTRYPYGNFYTTFSTGQHL